MKFDLAGHDEASASIIQLKRSWSILVMNDLMGIVTP